MSIMSEEHCVKILLRNRNYNMNNNIEYENIVNIEVAQELLCGLMGFFRNSDKNIYEKLNIIYNKLDIKNIGYVISVIEKLSSVLKTIKSNKPDINNINKILINL